MDRWATFDCYGTLIDWNGGIGRELERLFGADRASTMLHRYHEVEPQVQREEPTRSYRDVLAITLSRLGDVPAEEQDALEEVYEPFLIQIGFLDRTPRGRVATRLAYEHLGIEMPRKMSLF